MKKNLNSMLLILITLITVVAIYGYKASKQTQTVDNSLVNKIDSTQFFEDKDFRLDEYDKQLNLPDINEED